MNPPFLLANNSTIFHSDNIKTDTTSEDQYYLVCFLYQLLSQLHSGSTSNIRSVTMSDYDHSTDTFIIDSNSYTPYQAMHSLVTQLPSREYLQCRDSNEYVELLDFTIAYASMYGIITSNSQSIPNKKIDSPYWHVESEWYESTKDVYHNEVIANIKRSKKDNRAPCIVTGGTGTGKTKVIPKLFFYYYSIYTADKFFLTGVYANDVILALPRVFLAEGVYNDYQSSLGYKKRSKSDVGKSYQTPLKLLAGGKVTEWPVTFPGPKFIIGTSESLFKYSNNCGLAMIDEFHEHDLKSDIFFSLLFKAEAHIIIITATPSNADNILFPKFMPNSDRIHIASTKVFTIKQSSIKADLTNYLSVALKETIRVSSSLQQGQALLVFLPRVADVNKFIQQIEPKVRDIKLVPFHSAISEESREIISKYENTSRMIIVATQAAESSVTFPTLINVIDAGLEVRIMTEQMGDFHTYELRPVVQYINKYQYLQRRGRVGRLQTGSVIVLYDPDKLSTLAPNILDGNLTTLALLMKKFNLTIDDLFVTATGSKRNEFDRITSIVANINIDNINVNYLKNIYWLESISYYSNTFVPDSDKKLYTSLWSQMSYSEATKIYNRIEYPSYIPTRKLIFSNANNKYVKLVEEVDSKTRLNVTIPLDCFSIGRVFYKQISLTYTQPS